MEKKILPGYYEANVLREKGKAAGFLITLVEDEIKYTWLQLPGIDSSLEYSSQELKLNEDGSLVPSNRPQDLRVGYADKMVHLNEALRYDDDRDVSLAHVLLIDAINQVPSRSLYSPEAKYADTLTEGAVLSEFPRHALDFDPKATE